MASTYACPNCPMSIHSFDSVIFPVTFKFPMAIRLIVVLLELQPKRVNGSNNLGMRSDNIWIDVVIACKIVMKNMRLGDQYMAKWDWKTSSHALTIKSVWPSTRRQYVGLCVCMRFGFSPLVSHFPDYPFYCCIWYWQSEKAEVSEVAHHTNESSLSPSSSFSLYVAHTHTWIFSRFPFTRITVRKLKSKNKNREFGQTLRYMPLWRTFL